MLKFFWISPKLVQYSKRVLKPQGIVNYELTVSHLAQYYERKHKRALRDVTKKISLMNLKVQLVLFPGAHWFLELAARRRADLTIILSKGEVNKSTHFQLNSIYTYRSQLHKAKPKSKFGFVLSYFLTSEADLEIPQESYHAICGVEYSRSLKCRFQNDIFHFNPGASDGPCLSTMTNHAWRAINRVRKTIKQ